MPKRRLLRAVLASAVSAALITGCSSGKTTGAAGASTTAHPAFAGNETSAAQTAPAAPLNSRQCADVNEANVNLLAASDKDGARKAAESLERYHPPATVKSAIEHFVSTAGAHFDDPGYPKNYKVLDDWVEQVCPAQ